MARLGASHFQFRGFLSASPNWTCGAELSQPFSRVCTFGRGSPPTADFLQKHIEIVWVSFLGYCSSPLYPCWVWHDLPSRLILFAQVIDFTKFQTWACFRQLCFEEDRGGCDGMMRQNCDVQCPLRQNLAFSICSCGAGNATARTWPQSPTWKCRGQPRTCWACLRTLWQPT